MLLWFTWTCYGWGWSSWAAHGHQFGYTCAIAPWVAMQAAHWWGLTPAVRAITGYPWTRRGMMMNQFRFGVLPMALVLSLLDIGAWIAGSLESGIVVRPAIGACCWAPTWPSCS
jgi:hypothetical protein